MAGGIIAFDTHSPGLAHRKGRSTDIASRDETAVTMREGNRPNPT